MEESVKIFGSHQRRMHYYLRDGAFVSAIPKEMGIKTARRGRKGTGEEETASSSRIKKSSVGERGR